MFKILQFNFFLVDCGMPKVYHSSIELETFDGISQYGAQITYACKSPIFYNTTGTITCQSNAAWSTAHCEYGI